MELPFAIIDAVNEILGVSGRPHFADIPHRQLATECVVWEMKALPEPNGIDAKLAIVRLALANKNAIAYKSVDWWWGPYQTKAHRIVVGPSSDQFDIVRFEQGPSPYSDSEYRVAGLRKFDHEYGIDITGAAYQVVEFALKRIPVGQNAIELSKRILEFAPDIEQGSGMRMDVLDFNHNNGRVALWWD